MSANTATKKMNKHVDLTGTSTGYKVFVVIVLILVSIFFLFPLYWIVTGSFKPQLEITSRVPIWFPIEPTTDNYARLFEHPAFLWLFNIVFISGMAMVLTCITASLAGYALAKKRFIGRAVLLQKGKLVGDVTTLELEEQGKTLMDFVKETYRYKAERVVRALKDLTGEEEP